MKNIYVYSGKGTDKKCVEKTVEALNLIEGVQVLKINTLSDKIFEDCALYVQPGGHAILQIFSIGLNGMKKIKKYVENGGKYLGICAGVILAASKFFLMGIEYEHNILLQFVDVVHGIYYHKGNITLDSGNTAYYYKSPYKIQDKNMKILDTYQKNPIIITKTNILLIGIHLEDVNPNYFISIVKQFII